jgi:hypothetical protein
MHYETFLHIEYTLHQVCSSTYVSDQWINYMADSYDRFDELHDFRMTGPQIFQGLKALCQLANDSISASLLQFYSSKYLSAFAIPTGLFQSEAETLIQQFLSSTTTSLLLSLRRIRDTTQTNALFSGLLSNFDVYTYQDSSYLGASSILYNGDCDCAVSSECITGSYIYEHNSWSLWWYVRCTASRLGVENRFALVIPHSIELSMATTNISARSSTNLSSLR